MIEDKKALVRQSNQLIEATYKMSSIGEARLIRMLICAIKPNDEDFKTYSISALDFASIFNLEKGGGLYLLIQESAKKLMDREILFEDVTKSGKKAFKMFRWLSYAEYKPDTGSVEVRFDKALKPYLLQLQEYYTQYQIKNIVNFRSVYSVRLYELLKTEQFKQNKNGYFKRTFEYEEVREKLGVSDENYKLFSDFRIFVIQQAIKEINANDDLHIIQVDYPKTGKKVSHIVFHCEKAKQKQLPVDEEPVLTEIKRQEHPQCVKDLILMGIDEATAYKWKKKFGVKRILRSIAYTQGMKKAGKIRDSVTGFLSRTIHDDISLAWENEQKAKQEKRAEEVKQEQAQREAEEVKVNQDREKRAEVWGQFLALSEEEQGQIIELVTSSKAILKQQYTKAGLESKAVQMEIIAHMRKI